MDFPANSAYFQDMVQASRISTGQGVWTVAAVMLALLFLCMGQEAGAQTKTPPYWASISASEARMRVGPSLDYPSSWVYRRRDLPVRVVQVHGNWRKVADESGTEGWMHVRLLSDTPTAMVTAGEGRMYRKTGGGGGLAFRAQKGVVGRLSECSRGWCLFDVGGRRGYIEVASLWGAVR